MDAKEKIEQAMKDYKVDSRDISSKIELYLSEGAKSLLNKKHDSTVLEIINKNDTDGSQPTIYKLCQYIGLIVDKNIDKLEETDYIKFANFISVAEGAKLIRYATLMPPFALRLTNERTLLKLYVFSDFDMQELNKRLKNFTEFKVYIEGGLPF